MFLLQFLSLNITQPLELSGGGEGDALVGIHDYPMYQVCNLRFLRSNGFITI